MRPWIKAYTARVTEAEFLSLTDGAVALWYKCNLWVGLNETDGIIPAVEVERLKGTPSKVKRLLDAGFWEETETDNGKPAYRIVGWCDDQLTAKEVKELRERGADRTAKSRRKSGQNSRVSEQNSGVSDQNSRVSENKPPKFRSQEGPDQREREAVTPLEESREEEIRRDESVCLPDRPEGGAHTLKNKGKTKDESEGETNPNRPRNGMDQLAARFPAPRTSSAEVDVSATEDQDTSSWDSRELSIGKPLERMSPNDLLRYIVLSQDEINGIKLSGSGSKGVATMKRFQNHYGPERAAAIMRHLFVKERGRYEVGKNGIEHITQNHFTEPLSWFTDKVDVKAQAKDSRRKGMASEFVFATEL